MWVYKDKEIHSHDDLFPECTDIVYELLFSDGTKYIGKKTVKSMRRLKPTKKQLAIRKNYKRIEQKNIPFINYEGSSKENDGKTLVSKEILYQCSTKKAATYIETAMLFNLGAILSDEYNNKNILGKFYDNDLDGLIEE
jgi:hypothetical protein